MVVVGQQRKKGQADLRSGGNKSPTAWFQPAGVPIRMLPLMEDADGRGMRKVARVQEDWGGGMGML